MFKPDCNEKKKTELRFRNSFKGNREKKVIF